MQLVHFDFSSTPFELHDDNYVLKAMQLCGRPQSDEPPQRFPEDRGVGPSIPDVVYQPQHVPHPIASAAAPSRPPTSPPPVPGILKARVKHEH
ncbi:hypothetical protein CRG98_014427 [Punica granatum]|uniref:Transcription factor DP C-terminal domain-containing protein n=1 Tax=Punica granatum TaxID=22663 RepID=A0A2I0KAH1_PUNGR|nr:hypothetical protein CRG98_014427 [Punica granatum]